MMGVASILPFIAVLTNPALIDTNIILNKMYQISSIIEVQDYNQFLIALGCLFFVFLVLSLLLKLLLLTQ